MSEAELMSPETCSKCNNEMESGIYHDYCPCCKDRVTDIFNALNNDLRFKIFQLIRNKQGKLNITELFESLNEHPTIPTFFYNLRILGKAGLIEERELIRHGKYAHPLMKTCYLTPLGEKTIEHIKTLEKYLKAQNKKQVTFQEFKKMQGVKAKKIFMNGEEIE